MSRRVLWMTPFPPRRDGHDGASQVMAQTLGALAPRHRVVLLTLRTPSEPAVDPEIAAACELVTEVPSPAWPRTLGERMDGLARRAGGAVRGVPGWPAALRAEPFGSRLRETVAAFDPELVQIEFQAMGRYLADLDRTRARRVLVVHEPGAAAAGDRRSATRGARRVAREIELHASRRWERRVLRAVDAAVVFTERDRLALTPAAGGLPLHVVPFGAEPASRPLDPVGEEPPGVLFVGNFRHSPNVAAARVLMSEILPAARRHVSDLRAWVVGPGPPEDLRRLADERTWVTGEVASVKPYLDRAAIVAAPLWEGGGMRVKVLEALGAGKALVATPLALEGIGVRDGEHVVMAGSPQAFAASLVWLAQAPSERARLGGNARRWAEAELGTSGLAGRYEAVWESVLEGAPHARA